MSVSVLALDLSLTGTGVAWPDGRHTTWRVDAIGVDRLCRLRNMLDTVLDDEARYHAGPDIVVLEEYAFSRGGAHSHEVGEWGGVARLTIHDAGIPFVAINPSSLKRYATGKGNATKPDMRMALFQRLGLDLRDDNQVDALWLRAMALDHYDAAPCAMPAHNREALTKVAWPELNVRSTP